MLSNVQQDEVYVDYAGQNQFECNVDDDEVLTIMHSWHETAVLDQNFGAARKQDGARKV